MRILEPCGATSTSNVGPGGPNVIEPVQSGASVYVPTPLAGLRAITPLTLRVAAGTVSINISSAWVFEPSNLFPTSAVFRAGLASFTKIAADTYAADNIRINNVLPGWIDSLPETEERRKGVPLGRYGKAEEIAATVAFLVSKGAAYSTGQNIRVDVGLTRSV